MITPNDRKLGERIKILRKTANLTQNKLSEQVGISEKYLQYIEKGSRQPSLKTIYKLAEAFNTPVKNLFNF